MREMKVRAWDKLNKEMVYSDKEDAFYINTKGVLFMYHIPRASGEIYKSYDVMQYIGLKDKDGIEIYEGDIVKTLTNIDGNFVNLIIHKYEVIFNNFSFQLKPIPKAMYTTSLILSEDTEIIIIGNIYEHKTLLEIEK